MYKIKMILLKSIFLTAHSMRRITLDYVKELCANKFNYYDRDGEDHYNCISAYIKSIVYMIWDDVLWRI